MAIKTKIKVIFHKLKAIRSVNPRMLPKNDPFLLFSTLKRSPSKTWRIGKSILQGKLKYFSIFLIILIQWVIRFCYFIVKWWHKTDFTTRKRRQYFYSLLLSQIFNSVPNSNQTQLLPDYSFFIVRVFSPLKNIHSLELSSWKHPKWPWWWQY